MNLTCSQIEILISFYLENELSTCLKRQFENHLSECETCRTKFDIIKEIYSEMKNHTITESFSEPDAEYKTNVHENFLHTKLSEYIDNELPNNENIKIKKYTITNKHARKELENSYNIRRLMSDSYKKTKAEAKHDFTKNILKRLELEDERQAGFHPAINLLIIFTVTVLIVTTIVLLSLSS